MPRKTPKFPRSCLAETLAKQWLKAANAPRMTCPIIKISWNKTHPKALSGHARGTSQIHLSLGVDSNLEDWLIMLAHELAHCVVNTEKYKQGFQGNGSHGPRFYWWFWRLLPRKYWVVVSDDWNHRPHASHHDISFQPD